MPVLSMFYGIIVSMYFLDNKRHHTPHIHVKYQGEEVVVSIPDGTVVEGAITESTMRLLLAWIEIHKDELVADWELASQGSPLFKIDPLK